MTKAEMFEYNQIIEQMACHPDSTQIARMGQGFHARIAEKYGRDFALSVTGAMMDAVAKIRLSSQSHLIHPLTGEALE